MSEGLVAFSNIKWQDISQWYPKLMKAFKWNQMQMLCVLGWSRKSYTKELQPTPWKLISLKIAKLYQKFDKLWAKA